MDAGELPVGVTSTPNQLTVMIPHFAVEGLLAFVVYVLIRQITPPSLSKIRGPKSSSFVFGNLLELFYGSAGQTDFEWQRLYGDVVRFKTVLGRNHLFISDPKALQRIFTTYRYQKQRHQRAITRMLVGKGIVWADGEDHERHRKILLPGFGHSETKAHLDIFRGCAESMCAEWMELIGDKTDRRNIDISSWLSRATLDAIGQAAFDVHFGSVQNGQHGLKMKYSNLRSDVFGRPSLGQILLQEISAYLPTGILELITDYGSHPRLKRARDMLKVSTEVARELVHEKSKTLSEGKGSRDIFSLLVRANMDANAKNTLTEEELLAQMRTILLAGHETTSTTLCWILLELARHPEIQSKLRSEIRTMEATVRARGDAHFTAADFDRMSYLTAVVKEGLRYHPVVPHSYRIACKDDVLPLSRPITTESGEIMNELVVPKGTPIVASIAAYNRNKELWGADAHEFNPSRWMDADSKTKFASVGVYANLLTFIGGTRACLGWRFALIEIQAFLVEILSKFELKMTERSEKVYRGPPVLMLPMVEGEPELGSQMPLAVLVTAQ